MLTAERIQSVGVEQFLAEREQKELVRFVVVGSVDDGKSTFIGRLLYETDSLPEDQVAQVRRACKQDGGEELDFSLFTDGLLAEREQAITIDVAYRYFTTARRKFIIADTPGHVQYTRNMATGASTADVGVILLDARLGVLPQSRRHAYIASLLGIPRLAVAVNKMDLVGWAPEAFLRIQGEFGAFAARLGFAGVHFFPVSARTGDNIARASERTPWHRGGTVLDFLESVPVGQDPDAQPWRLPVQYVLRPHLDYRGFAGPVAAGRVRVGEEVVVLPSGRRTRIKALDTWEGPCESVHAPQSVTVRLADEVDVSRGDMLARPAEAPRVAQQLDAMLIWLDERPLDPARAYLLKHTTRRVPARVERVHWRTDLETLAPVPVASLALNDIGRVTVRCQRPVMVDAYAQSRATGAFILIDALTNATVAAGLVLAPEAAAPAAGGGDESDPAAAGVSAAERRQRLGHGAALVYLERADAGEARALACALERALFERGVLGVVVEGHEAAQACAQAGLVALCLAPADALARERLRAQLRVAEVPLLELRGEEERPVQSALEALARLGVLSAR